MNRAIMEIHFSNCTLCGKIQYFLDSKTVPFFILDDRFCITTMTDGDGKNVSFEKYPDRSTVSKQSCYAIKEIDTKQFEIEFASVKQFKRHWSKRKSSDRYNFFEDKRIFLYDNYIRFYPSLAYPDDTERIGMHFIQCRYEPLTVYGLDGYEVLFAEKQGNSYIIQPLKSNRCLIYALRKDSCYITQCGQFRAITQKKSEYEYAQAIVRTNNEVLDWYNSNLYADKPAQGNFQLVSLGFTHNVNAYVCDSLTVYENFQKLPKVCESYIPHELGHIWNISENFTAEGFLDEGGAEWSAEIYRFYHDKNSFEKHRKEYEKFSEKYWAKLCANRKFDNTDPEIPNRHMLGFRFYNRIYREFGLDTACRCILCYALLNDKSLDAFLTRVQQTEDEKVFIFVQNEVNDIISRFPKKKNI